MSEQQAIPLVEVQAMVGEILFQRDAAQQRCCHLAAEVASLKAKVSELQQQIPITVEE